MRLQLPRSLVIFYLLGLFWSGRPLSSLSGYVLSNCPLFLYFAKSEMRRYLSPSLKNWVSVSEIHVYWQIPAHLWLSKIQKRKQFCQLLLTSELKTLSASEGTPLTSFLGLVVSCRYIQSWMTFRRFWKPWNVCTKVWAMIRIRCFDW